MILNSKGVEAIASSESTITGAMFNSRTRNLDMLCQQCFNKYFIDIINIKGGFKPQVHVQHPYLSTRRELAKSKDFSRREVLNLLDENQEGVGYDYAGDSELRC